ncbi:MAG: GNAT family N-acetyltransferase [Chloroflexi bacterium]|nr:GNAT family N-acetyltransferase [Chloroflexota bacterium]
MKIETDRLIIRSIQEADAESLATLWTDPDVTLYMGGPRNYEEVLGSLIEDAQLNPQPVLDLWPVIEKRTGQIIGHCGIIEKDVEGGGEYEIVYVLAKSAWGKGFATEAANSVKDYAFNHLGLKRLIALIDPDNPKSQKTAMNIGLKHEKDTVRPNGKSMRVFAIDIEDCQR